LKSTLAKLNDGYNIIPATRDDADLFNLDETKKFIDKINPDILINAAAKVGGIVANNTNRTEFILENLKININVLESCIPHSHIKIINLGSSCIYPLNASNPISEDSFMDGKLEPTNSPYAMAKLSGIELGRSLKAQFGHKVINLMPTNLYGPNDNFSEIDSHVIPGLIKRMHIAKNNKEKEFKIWGSGKPLREFLYVEDLSKAISLLIEKDTDEDILNVGSGKEVSIKELAMKIKNVIGFQGDLKFDKTKPDGNPRKLLDSSKINELGWFSEVSLDDGLIKTYEWFLKNN
tara:strand:+ start:359 stop:1231 length:873 start_codon:yes stop_codon:yes gene_type:complete